MILSAELRKRALDGENLVERGLADLAALAQGDLGEQLEGAVGRRRDAVFEAEQRDLAVEIVGLNRWQAAAKRLPGGAAAALDPLDVLGG